MPSGMRTSSIRELRRRRTLEIQAREHARRHPNRPFVAPVSRGCGAKLVLGVPVLNRYDLLQRLLDSVARGTRRPDRYVIVDNGGAIEREIESGLRIPRPNTIVSPGQNVGVSCAWNLILDEAPNDFVILSNDDIEVEFTTLATMEQEACLSPHLLIAASNQNAWAFCLQKPGLTRAVGHYDEHYWPAYVEDMDMCLKMLLRNLQIVYAIGVRVSHAGHASTRAAHIAESWRQQVRECFEKNRQYFRQKWPGIDPHTLVIRDRTITPFRGRPPTDWTERPITEKLATSIRKWSV